MAGSKKVIQIYADGACRGNNQQGRAPGAYGVVLLYGNVTKELKGFFHSTTNNRMEIMAVIKGLKAIKDKSIPVEVYSDSQYVVSTINEHWAKKINIDYWTELYQAMAPFKEIKFIKVKGHSDNVHNNRADQLANEALDENGIK